jgi:peptide chain release factor 2
LSELNALSEDPDLWNNAQKAQKIMQERTILQQNIDAVVAVEQSLNDNVEMIAMAEEEGDDDLVVECEETLALLQVQSARMELESLLSGEADKNDAYLEVNSGAGGTEACDWALMILRMYTRWAESKGYKIELLDQSDGEEAGIKSATIQVKGHNAYGWLKGDNGVHRLVRISPFDSAGRRHTSFASVSVSPVIDDTIDIEIEEKDLRIDTFRSSGAGGQHVNTTDSAVRITHIPTNIVVSCQNQRSQHQNRDSAMNMLKARLYEAEIQRREQAKTDAHGEKTDIGWGYQIRSYVLHPYQMIKDLRTGAETNQSDKVLNGDLDLFLESALAYKLGGEE